METKSCLPGLDDVKIRCIAVAVLSFRSPALSFACITHMQICSRNDSVTPHCRVVVFVLFGSCPLRRRPAFIADSLKKRAACGGAVDAVCLDICQTTLALEVEPSLWAGNGNKECAAISDLHFYVKTIGALHHHRVTDMSADSIVNKRRSLCLTAKRVKLIILLKLIPSCMHDPPPDPGQFTNHQSQTVHQSMNKRQTKRVMKLFSTVYY